MKKIFCTLLLISILTHSAFTQIIPNDSLYKKQQWALDKIKLPDVWCKFTTGGVTADGDTIVVAVIDGSFYLNSDDLSFRKDGVDAYYDPPANLTGSDKPNDHGTSVARVIGAIGDNGIGTCGVNWDVKILPVRGSSSFSLNVQKNFFI
jgi:subtilisin family serine protease